MVDTLDDADGDELMELTFLTMEGRAALDDGDGPRALEILSRKHERVLKMFEADSGTAGTSLVDVAEALHLAGRLKEARRAIDEAHAIFKRLDRRDAMRDRLEAALIDICRQQGHSFVVEDVLRERLADASQEDVPRAIEQDELAMQYANQREYHRALPLLMDSKAVFERTGKGAEADLAVCCGRIARVFLETERFDDAVTYGGQAVAAAQKAHGDESPEATIANDELAVSLALCARRDNNVQAARESIALSDTCVRRFAATQGPSGREAARSLENNHRLRHMLRSLVALPREESPMDLPATPALPTYCFVSHAYADAEALDALLKRLPRYVKPVVFEAITAPPTEYVSEKLIRGVLGADGVVFIDSAVSNASFWCAFERDLAARKQKHMFRFDPESGTIEDYKVEPRDLKLAHCFHDADRVDVERVMRWLVDERSFVAFHDDQKFGEQSFPPFASMPERKRELHLFSLRSFAALYLLFLSRETLADDGLRRHVIDQLVHHPRATLVCWLEAKPERVPDDFAQALSSFPDEHSVTFSRRPTHAGFSVHDLDNLGVRLFWIHHRTRSGDWSL